MRIIGCDLHARQQTLAMLDTETGEVVNLTLMHEGNEVREFYSQLPRPMLVGIEATGSMPWFLNLMEELGIECRVGHPATIRAAEPRKKKHDRRDADLILKLLAESRFPAIWLPTKELLDLRGLGAAPPPVGAHTNADPKRAAGHCLGQWLTTRSESVELRRASEDRVLAIAAPCFLSRRSMLQEMYRKMEEKIESLTQRVAEQAGQRCGAQLLMTHPGVGPVTALATEVFLGDARRFVDGKALARAHSTGILQRRTTAIRWSNQTRQSAFALSLV
jgi:transposase